MHMDSLSGLLVGVLSHDGKREHLLHHRDNPLALPLCQELEVFPNQVGLKKTSLPRVQPFLDEVLPQALLGLFVGGILLRPLPRFFPEAFRRFLA